MTEEKYRIVPPSSPGGSIAVVTKQKGVDVGVGFFYDTPKLKALDAANVYAAQLNDLEAPRYTLQGCNVYEKGQGTGEICTAYARGSYLAMPSNRLEILIDLANKAVEAGL